MKKTIIAIYKILNNSFEVEVVEKTSFSVFPIYKTKLEILKFTKNNLMKFVEQTKHKIETIIEGKLSDIVIFIESGQLLSISEKTITININDIDGLTTNLGNYFASFLKKQGLYLTDYSLIAKNNAKLFYLLKYIPIEIFQILADVMKINKLNIAKISDLNSLQNYSLLSKHESDYAVFIKLDSNKIDVQLSVNKNILRSKTIDLGFDMLINQISSKLNLSKSEVLTTIANLHKLRMSKIEKDIFLICDEFFSTIINFLNDFIEKKCKNFKLNLFIFNNKFKYFSFWTNSLNQKHKAKRYITENTNFLISEEAYGLMNILENYSKAQSELTITTELFTIDTIAFNKDNKNHLYNYQ
ncbi:hypothetical protein HGG64_03075 [Mycoplasma phocoeninasale]|uniref:Uncharacterized protein n=1 Tax=Mycoplasma phocoeninasale TaxID=2726117 RepID=A0A858U600_9MOLU|nr:hypothetical protein [Mycoplasma phocoeninasale]QJG66663.1 hypothetical protein HGG64_03075 [Mycoplasma phocoeninasale]